MILKVRIGVCVELLTFITEDSGSGSGSPESKRRKGPPMKLKSKVEDGIKWSILTVRFINPKESPLQFVALHIKHSRLCPCSSALDHREILQKPILKMLSTDRKECIPIKTS